MSDSTGGIRASGSGSVAEQLRRISLTDEISFGPWKSKLTSVMVSEDCMGIVNGTELEPVEIAEVINGDRIVMNDAAVERRHNEVKSWRKRYNKASSLITQSLDNSIVMSLDVHQGNPILMWTQLNADYNIVSDALKTSSRTDFLTFMMEEEDSLFDSKFRFGDLLRKVTEQGGAISVEDRLATLLGSLPPKFHLVRDVYYGQRPLPNIQYLWDMMSISEKAVKRRLAMLEASGSGGGAYYQSGGRGGGRAGGFRGGRAGGSGSGAGRSGVFKKLGDDNCYRCGESDHWSNECPKKGSVCGWCGGVGHLEVTCYSKESGVPRGSKAGSPRGGARGGARGRGRGRRGGYGRYGEGEEEYDPGPGHADVLMGEVNVGSGDGDGVIGSFVADSGADYHMSGDRSLFRTIEKVPNRFFVKQIKGEVDIKEWGSILLRTDKGDGVNGDLELKEVLYLPGMKVNIFSLQRIRKIGECSYTFEGKPTPGKKIPIYDKMGRQIATMEESSKARPTLMCEVARHGGEKEVEGEVLGAKGIDIGLLHKRLGHTSRGGLERLVREQMVRGLEDGLQGELKMCRGCKMGRSSEKPHPRKNPIYRAKEQLELVHTDIAGPFKPVAVGGGGGQYNLVIIDDFSRKSWTIPLRRKSDTKVALKDWITVNENQVGKRVKRLRSDNGGEFIDGELGRWFREHGILHQTIPARSPQSNGVAERMNRTLQDRARSMLVGAGLGGGFWVEAIGTASYIRNRGPVEGLSKTPDELWSGSVPSVKHLRAFGSKAYVSLEKFKRGGKMGETKWEGVIVGYPRNSVGYRVWDPVRGKVFNVGVPDIDESVEPGWWKKGAAGVVVEDLDPIIFPDLEDDFPAISDVEVEAEAVDEVLPELVEDESDDEGDEEGGGDGGGGAGDDWGPEDDAPEAGTPAGDMMEELGGSSPRHSNRPNRGVPPPRYIEAFLANGAGADMGEFPQTAWEALSGEDEEKWRLAMDSEMASLVENGVYELVERPEGKKVLGCRWIFRIKTDENGNQVKHKARVVAKGYNQVEGESYFQIFSPTVRFESVRQLAAVGASRGLRMHQMDVTTAFLYAPLMEEVYMERPEGTAEEGDHRVMRLLKCLYGLKQSPREWNKCVHEVLQKLGFTRLKSDVGIYVKGEGADAIYLALYVDDMFIVGEKLEGIEEVKRGLGREFKMKDLGEAKFLLGIEIRRQENGDVLLVQEKYAREVVERYNMGGSKPVSTPLELGTHLDSSQQPSSDAEREAMFSIPYRSAIGSLMYLATCTRPDISAAVSELSKFSQNPGAEHWEGVKRVVRYVGATAGDGLMFRRGAQIAVWGYSDAGHAGDHETSRGRHGYVFLSAGAAVSWRSSMMKLVTHSSCESEYVGLSEAGNEAVHLRQLQGELGIGEGSVVIMGDNESSIKLALNPVFHRRSKHIQIKFHSLRDRIEEGSIELCKVDTGLNAADMLTKNVGVGVLKICKGLVGMVTSG